MINFQQPPWMFVWLIPVVLGGTALVMLIMAELGGWRRLGRRYDCREKVDGTTWRMQSGSLGSAGYGLGLTITANAEGLKIAVSPLLLPYGFFHPPLSIPWEDIKAVRSRVFFYNYVTLIFAAHPDITFSISNRLAKKIQAASGQRWFEEE